MPFSAHLKWDAWEHGCALTSKHLKVYSRGYDERLNNDETWIWNFLDHGCQKRIWDQETEPHSMFSPIGCPFLTYFCGSQTLQVSTFSGRVHKAGSTGLGLPIFVDKYANTGGKPTIGACKFVVIKLLNRW